VLSKFTENDHEKVERIMELHFKYLDKVHAAETEGGAGGDDDDEDEAYLRRLDGGLFTLQQVL
jgi:beta-catenin-like protein 1